MKNSINIAIVQKKPAFLDLKESLILLEEYLVETAKENTNLVIFGETWLTGYPAWLDHIPGIAKWNHEPTKLVFEKMWENSLDLDSSEMVKICALAKKLDLFLVIGINEKKTRGAANRSIFNSLLFINNRGEIVNHHRKLMPTFTEKLLYGTGDGHGLKTVDSPYGKIGGLICWEHWMPLSRQSLHREGETIHIAVWPSVHEMHQLASRHYAFEGRCFVIAAGQIMQVADVPTELEWPINQERQKEEFLLNGGSCVIGPDGQFLLSPQFEQESIIYFEIKDLKKSIRESMTLDVSGHYDRPDVFDLQVNKKRLV